MTVEFLNTHLRFIVMVDDDDDYDDHDDDCGCGGVTKRGSSYRASIS